MGCASTSFAQAPTLTASTTNPIMGDEFVIVNCDTNVSPMSGGPAQTWDYSGFGVIVPTSYDTGRAVPPYATPVPAALYGSSNVCVYNRAASVYAYYVTGATKISQNGLYISPGTTETSYSDPMDQIRYPFSYDSSFTDTYAGTVNIVVSGSPVTAAEAGTVQVTGDGYGTLILPGIPTPVTHTNVLRVHSYQLFRDSANLFSTPFVVTDTLETFTWYTPGYHNPLMTIATGKSPLGDRYKVVSFSAVENPSHEGIPTAGIDASLKLYPNPAQNKLNIQYNTSTSQSIRITLSDMLGREVAVLADGNANGTQKISYNTASLAKGLYLVRLQSASETVTRKIEIQ